MFLKKTLNILFGKAKLLVILGTVLFFGTSCTDKLYVNSQDSYRQTTDQIKNELGNQGYSLIGEKKETKNEVSVEAVSYTRAGYGSKMQNNYWTYGEYSFLDSENNEVKYSLKFEEGTDFVYNVQVIGCSSSKNYDEICGESGVIKSNINNMNENPDSYIEVSNPSKTAGVVVGLSSIALFILLLVVLI